VNDDPIVAVPADLELEDRLAGPVTFRMAGWLAAAAAGVALLALSRQQIWTAGPGLLLVVGGLAGAMWRPGGRPAAAWLAPLRAYLLRSRADRVVRTEPDKEPATHPAAAADRVWPSHPSLEVDAPDALVGDESHGPPSPTLWPVMRQVVLPVVLAAGVLGSVLLVSPVSWGLRTVLSPGTSGDLPSPVPPDNPGPSTGAETEGADGSPSDVPPCPTADSTGEPAPPLDLPPELLFWFDDHHHDPVRGWGGCGC
jgi:hypothetical protein